MYFFLHGDQKWRKGLIALNVVLLFPSTSLRFFDVHMIYAFFFSSSYVCLFPRMIKKKNITKQYSTLSLLFTFQMTIEGAPLTILNVILECDRNVTPWCDCTENVGNTKPLQHKSENRDDVIVPKLDRKKHISHDG